METPAPEHRAPPGVSDETVEALGKLSEALEVVGAPRLPVWVPPAHRDGRPRPGRRRRPAAQAGHHEIADRIDRELVGRNVIEGRWTFQIVEDYDDGYYALFRQARGRGSRAGWSAGAATCSRRR